MYKNEYQGGPYLEVFSPQGKEPTAHWKISGSAKKCYDKEVKSYAFVLEGSPATTKMQIPKDARHSLHLVQRYLILQLAVRKGQDFSMELGVSDMGNNKRRLFFSTAQKEIHITPLHAKIPIKILKTGMWVNLCLDMVSMVGETWRGQTYQLLDSISISANCRLRKIFTMKIQPPDTTDDDELYGCASSNSGEIESVPKQCQFATDVQQVTQLLTINKVKHAERLRGGVGSADMRRSTSSPIDLDLNASGRKSSAHDMSFHIAFGSKIPGPGVPTSHSASRKSARETNRSKILRRRTISNCTSDSPSFVSKYRGNLTNRSTRSNSRAEDGVGYSTYQDMSVSITSRDGLYTGRDPGGGAINRDPVPQITRQEPPQMVPNPPDQGKPFGYRKGHQRQYSDPVSLSETENGIKNPNEEVPLVQPHPPREPSYDRVRRRPRVKNGSAGKDRISSAGSAKDEGIGTSVASSTPPSKASSQISGYHDGMTRHRLMSDGELLNTSSSSNESGPRGKSAEHQRKGPVPSQRHDRGDIRRDHNGVGAGSGVKKEYHRENYQPVGADLVDESVTDVIAILKRGMDLRQDTEEEEEESSEEEVASNSAAHPGEYEESDEEESGDKGMYLFASQPMPAPRQKNISPLPGQLEEESALASNTPPKSTRAKTKESRGPRPEDDFIDDDSSDEDQQKLSVKPGSRPGSGNRPNSDSRPNSGSRPGSSSRPNSGSRSVNIPKPSVINRPSGPSGSKSLMGGVPSDKPVHSSRSHGRTHKHDQTAFQGSSKGVDICRTVQPAEGPGPSLAESPTMNGQYTSRSSLSRMSRKSLREIPMPEPRISMSNIAERPYDFTKYVMEDLTASAEARMLEEIQGARSAEFEPENCISPRKEAAVVGKSPRPVQQAEGGGVRHIYDDSPTTTSDDDTSFSTWKAPPPKSHNYQKEMKGRLSSDTLTSSNPRDWSGVCSPPVLRGAPISNSLDDVSMSSLSPRKPPSGGNHDNSPRITDDEEELDLLYDQQLNCYYDPKTCKYYELS